MKKVLIVSAHFPPLNTMASKRYGYMCKYMEKYGYEPYIITTRPRGGGYINAKLDLKVPLSEERIIRIGDLGIVYPCQEMEINEVVKHYNDKGIQSRIIDEESLGWYYKVKNELNINKISDADIVIGTFPSIGNALVAKYISEMIGKPFLIEIRDLISDYKEESNRKDVYQDIELELEKKIIDGAAGIITVTSGFKSILSERYPQKIIDTVYNGWDNENTLIDSDVHEDYLYYAGSLYEHRVESLKLLIETIKESNLDVKVKIRSIGPQKLEDELRKYVTDILMEDKVEILSAENEIIIEEEQAKAKVNLLISSMDAKDRALMTTLPGKLFELIRLNNPVLAIVDKSAEIGEILQQTKKGRIASNKNEIIDFLKGNLNEYEGYHVEVEKYSRKRQAEILCDLLDKIIGGKYSMNKLVSSGLAFISGTVTGLAVRGTELNKVIASKQQEKEKFRIMYQMMEKWLSIRMQGKRLENYFAAYEYTNIAIYGMGDIGKDLIAELKKSSVNIVYAIDKSVTSIEGIKIVKPDDTLEEVDAVIVTAIAYFDEINEMLSKKMECPIVSLEDIIYEMG